jgi:hypothetical protein
VGYWEYDIVTGADHKGAIVKMVERKSGYAVMVKLLKMTSDSVNSAIVDTLKHLTTGKSLQDTLILINNSKARLTLPDYLIAGSEEAMKNSIDCCIITSQKSEPCSRSLMWKLE